MSTKHTPGPWHWVGTKKHPESFCYLQNDEYESVGLSLDGFTICPANARLIAAAPDLLEALQQAQMALAGIVNRNGIVQAALGSAAKAIAKATGEE